jgi:hypothetical protein
MMMMMMMSVPQKKKTATAKIAPTCHAYQLFAQYDGFDCGGVPVTHIERT